MASEFVAERGEADSGNWIDAPHNRWGFLHVRELASTVRIGGSREPVEPLPRRLHDIEGVHVRSSGATVDDRRDARGDVHRRIHGRARWCRVARALRGLDATHRYAPADVGLEVADVDARRCAGRRRSHRPGAIRARLHPQPSGHIVGGLHAATPARHARRHEVRRGRLRQPRQRRTVDRAGLGLHHADPFRPSGRHLRVDPSDSERLRARRSVPVPIDPARRPGVGDVRGDRADVCRPLLAAHLVARSLPTTRRSSSTRPDFRSWRVGSARRWRTSPASG